MSYKLITSGKGLKVEQFGEYLIERPASQAVWLSSSPNKKHLSASFTREEGNRWEYSSLPNEWHISIDGIKFKLSTTDFGHLGIFPEQRPQWNWIKKQVKNAGRPIELLNLFAYSGGSTLAAASAGASVCHLDASKGMVEWARENAALNGLHKAPIRWIADDALKFIKREIRRGRRYDAIVLDPPTFGRGTKGELFKIEEDIIPLLQCCRDLLSEKPLFILLSCHTPGFTPTTLKHLLNQTMPSGTIENGEMFLEGDQGVLPLPSGTFARWQPC